MSWLKAMVFWPAVIKSVCNVFKIRTCAVDEGSIPTRIQSVGSQNMASKVHRGEGRGHGKRSGRNNLCRKCPDLGPEKVTKKKTQTNVASDLLTANMLYLLSNRTWVSTEIFSGILSVSKGVKI